MEGLRRRRRNPKTQAQEGLEWASNSLILVAPGTVPLEASPGCRKSGSKRFRVLS